MCFERGEAKLCDSPTPKKIELWFYFELSTIIQERTNISVSKCPSCFISVERNCDFKIFFLRVRFRRRLPIPALTARDPPLVAWVWGESLVTGGVSGGSRGSSHGPHAQVTHEGRLIVPHSRHTVGPVLWRQQRRPTAHQPELEHILYK